MKDFVSRFDLDNAIQLINSMAGTHPDGSPYIDPALIQTVVEFIQDPTVISWDDFDINYFIKMPEVINEYIALAGGLYIPEIYDAHLYLEKFGQMFLVEFESEAQMFAYVQQEGYGWDEDKPAICYGF